MDDETRAALDQTPDTAPGEVEQTLRWLSQLLLSMEQELTDSLLAAQLAAADRVECTPGNSYIYNPRVPADREIKLQAAREAMAGFSATMTLDFTALERAKGSSLTAVDVVQAVSAALQDPDDPSHIRVDRYIESNPDETESYRNNAQALMILEQLLSEWLDQNNQGKGCGISIEYEQQTGAGYSSAEILEIVGYRLAEPDLDLESRFSQSNFILFTDTTTLDDLSGGFGSPLLTKLRPTQLLGLTTQDHLCLINDTAAALLHLKRYEDGRIKPVFSDYGTGKSYMLRALQARVQELSPPGAEIRFLISVSQPAELQQALTEGDIIFIDEAVRLTPEQLAAAVHSGKRIILFYQNQEQFIRARQEFLISDRLSWLRDGLHKLLPGLVSAYTARWLEAQSTAGERIQYSGGNLYVYDERYPLFEQIVREQAEAAIAEFEHSVVINCTALERAKGEPLTFEDIILALETALQTQTETDHIQVIELGPASSPEQISRSTSARLEKTIADWLERTGAPHQAGIAVLYEMPRSGETMSNPAANRLVYTLIEPANQLLSLLYPAQQVLFITNTANHDFSSRGFASTLTSRMNRRDFPDLPKGKFADLIYETLRALMHLNKDPIQTVESGDPDDLNFMLITLRDWIQERNPIIHFLISPYTETDIRRALRQGEIIFIDAAEPSCHDQSEAISAAAEQGKRIILFGPEQ